MNAQIVKVIAWGCKILFLGLALSLGGASAHAQYFAYITNSTDGTVSVIDTATNAVVATIPVGTAPQSIAVTPNGAFAYVANSGSSPGTVSVIDTTTNSVAATIPVGNVPIGIAIAPNGTFAYVSNTGDDAISVIDTFTNTVTATLGLPAGFCGPNSPCGIVFTQKGTYAYVAGNSTGQIAVINTTTGAVATTIFNGAQNGGTIALSPDHSTAYVPLYYGYLSVINTSTNTQTTLWSLNGGQSGISLDGLAVTPDNATVYVEAEEQNRVLVVPVASGTASASISVGNNPNGLAMTPDGAYVYVTNTNDDTVSVIQVATNTVIATVPVGNAPYAVTIATPRDYSLLNGGNTFNGNQTVDGSVSAANFLGNGSGLTNVNAATLGSIPASSYARLDVGNSFSGNQSVSGSVTATTFYGDGSNLTNVTSTSATATNALALGGQPPSFYATTGANTFSATQTIGAGNLALPNTTSSTSGVVTLGGNPFLHNYGTFNTFVGLAAGNFSMTGQSNTGVGVSALQDNSTGINNTATGYVALPRNTSGSNNTAEGYGALEFSTTGSNNTATGFWAGLTANTNNANTTGSGNTFIGSYSGAGVASSANLQNATAIGSNAVVSASNSLVLGSINGVNGATASVKVGIGTATPAYALDVEGGQINASGGICIAGNCLTNTMLANPYITVTAGSGLTGGGTIPLGGTTTLNLATHTCAAGTALTALPADTCTAFAGLGANTFTGTQTMPSLSVAGAGTFTAVSASGGSTYGIYGTSTNSTLGSAGVAGIDNASATGGYVSGVYGQSNYGNGVYGLSANWFGVSGSSLGHSGVYAYSGSTVATDAAALLSNGNGGNILLGENGTAVKFLVDGNGDVTATGVAKFPSYSVSGTAPTCSFSTGGGTGPTCTLDTGSTNSAGIIIATTGTGAPAGTGTITLTFSSAFGTDKPVCMYEASDVGTGTWNGLAVMKDKIPSIATDVFTWTNGAAPTPLIAARTYYINYHCFAK